MDLSGGLMQHSFFHHLDVVFLVTVMLMSVAVLKKYPGYSHVPSNNAG